VPAPARVGLGDGRTVGGGGGGAGGSGISFLTGLASGLTRTTIRHPSLGTDRPARYRAATPLGSGGPTRAETVDTPGSGSAANPLAERDRARAAGGRTRPRIPSAGVRIHVAAF
jgi:hypothetical protein